MELTVDRAIDARAERVWSLITDLDRAPEMLSGVQQVERLDGGGEFDVGTRWRETRTMFGREGTEELEVTALDAGRSYTTTAASQGAVYTSVLAVEPLGADRSHLSMTFAAEPAGTVSRLLAATIGRAFQGATRRMLQRDLDDIASAATRPAG
jgi:carbon monoxide dehydrogenase subunit G